MKCLFLVVSSFVTILLCFQYGVRGDGFIMVKLTRYINPGGLGSNGHCCDGKFGVCQKNGCDHKFTICLDKEYHEDNIDPLTCDYGQQQTSRIKNSNTIDFGTKVGETDNPMTFVVIGPLPDTFKMMLEVWDDDEVFSDDFVELLKGEVAFPANPSVFFPVVLEDRTRLEAIVWRECLEEWYGKLCDTYCPAPRPYHRYRCNTTNGHKICDQGWIGENCDVLVTRPVTTPTTTTTTTPISKTTAYSSSGKSDCQEWAAAGYAGRDGVYGLTVPGYPPFHAWCRMDRYGKGWTVIQRRNGNYGKLVNFTRDWEAYKHGFGDIGWDSELWLGLNKIHQMTTNKRYALHIKMQIGTGEWKWANYNHFWIDNEDKGYALHVEGYTGIAGNALEYQGMGGLRNHQGRPFSTYNHDNDAWLDGNCAQRYQSGWWFNDCAWANLNGLYTPPFNGWPRCRGPSCIGWRTIKGYENYSLLATEMSLIPES